MASFFYCGRLPSAQLDRWQAPKQRPIIDRHPVEQIAYRRDIKDNGYKSVFTNSWLVRQRNRSWIKGLGKNPQKSDLIHWQQCLLSGATEPCPLGRHHAQCHATRQNSECELRRPRLKNKLRVYTASDANWLRSYISNPLHTHDDD